MDERPPSSLRATNPGEAMRCACDLRTETLLPTPATPGELAVQCVPYAAPCVRRQQSRCQETMSLAMLGVRPGKPCVYAVMLLPGGSAPPCSTPASVGRCRTLKTACRPARRGRTTDDGLHTGRDGYDVAEGVQGLPDAPTWRRRAACQSSMVEHPTMNFRSAGRTQKIR